MKARPILAALIFYTLTASAGFSELWDALIGPPQSNVQPVVNMQTVNRPPQQIISEPGYIQHGEYTSLSHTRFTQDWNGYMAWLRLGNGRYDTRPGPPPTVMPRNGYRKLKVYPFNQIEINGPFHVSIRPTKGPRRISITGPRRTLSHLLAMVKDNRLVLEIATNEYLPGFAEVEIEVNEVNYISYIGNGDLRMSYVKSPMLNAYFATVGNVYIEGHKIGLRKLALNGAGNIVMSGISSQRLEVDSKGNDRVAITGVQSLQELVYTGNTRLSMYWIDSPHLSIQGYGNGYARLAGHTALLEAELFNYATLDAKYLRATRSFVKTFNVAQAHIQSVHDQSTLAEDKSNIYFYNRSKFRNDYMADNGSVLDYMAFARK